MAEAVAQSWGWGAGTEAERRKLPPVVRPATERALDDLEMCATVEAFAALCRGSESATDPPPPPFRHPRPHKRRRAR